MITFILLAAVALLVIGGIVVAVQANGQKGKAGKAVATAQRQMNNPRGDVRSSGSAND